MVDMANGKSAEVYQCFQFNIEGYHYFIFLLVLPVHSLLIKVLMKDLRLRMPRHIIMLSMSISDLIQSQFAFICHFIVSAFESGTDTALCRALREITMFVTTLTMVVSSLGVIAMSVERYISCIHSFHIHRIFTQDRVVYGSIIQWVIGILLAITEVLTNTFKEMTTVTVASAFQIIYITFTFAATIPVCVIQARLFFFAKTKLKRVNPAQAFGAQLELADYRKKHIKVAFVSGIVALGFIVCILPTAFLFLYEIIKDTTASVSARQICFSFGTANCLVDPFIYGIGNVDTRKMILRNLKKAKQFIMVKLCPSKVEPGAFTVDGIR